MFNDKSSKWVHEKNPITEALLEIKQINKTMNDLLKEYDNLVKEENANNKTIN